MTDMIRDASISDCGLYRYNLIREWATLDPVLLFIMLNPSTADAEVDDPTIRRCISFAKDNGYGSIEVVNLFAFRATNPDELKKAADPVGPNNDDVIQEAAEDADGIICAWGTKGALMNRDAIVKDYLTGVGTPVYCLGLTKGGHPKHPLYVPAATKIPEFPLQGA